MKERINCLQFQEKNALNYEKNVPKFMKDKGREDFNKSEIIINKYDDIVDLKKK